MGRERSSEHAGLPPRWRVVKGVYYYQVPQEQRDKWDGKTTFRLGDSLDEAYRAWTQRMGAPNDAKNVGELLDRYAREVIPGKAPRTQTENRRAVMRLRAVFGKLSIAGIRPQMIYQYATKSSTTTQGRKEIRTFSHVFTKAVEWGLIDRHPFKGEVRLKGEPPRTRYVEDWEFAECMKLQSKRSNGSIKMIQAYLRIKLLTGLRLGDLLRLTMGALREDGIHVLPRKTAHTTGKRIIIEWSPALLEAVEMAKAARPAKGSPGDTDYLFCTRRNECYFDEERGTSYGWNSMWQRFMERLLEETEVTERFTEHDIRAKAASDAETLEHAQKLLAHADSKITDRVYRRKPEKVKPLR
jgi:integrase